MRARVVKVWAVATCALVQALVPVSAQGPGAPWSFVPPPPGETVMGARGACAELRALTNNDVSIESARVVPAVGDVPEHCVVRGQIQPQIRFEVTLPAQWNRRLYMIGNGGYAGESLNSEGVTNTRNQATRGGFVFIMQNTGHDAASEPLGSFAVDRQKLLDYAFRSLKVTSDAGKWIAEAYYGARPAKSYFEGCSTGGRQALILAQRFPDAFDGLVAGAPVLDFTGTMISFIQRFKAFAKTPVPYAKVAELASRIYGACDEKDGAKDGIIDDPRRCDFKPPRDLPPCAEGVSDNGCFTPGEIASLEVFYSEVNLEGRKVFPGWPVGAEIAGTNNRPGWDNWVVTERANPTVAFLFAESFARYVAFPEKNATLDPLSLDLDKTFPRLSEIRQILDAKDSDLTAFQKRGGKLFMYFGWADQALNPMMGVEYYESVLAKMGADVPRFFRLFMVPGMFHCGGGVGCGTFDRLTPTIEWVERGTAPDRIVASRMAGGKAVRTRPLCPYPQVAVYDGKSSIDEAASFACQAR